MLKRDTWHKCANDLDKVCQEFRDAYWRSRRGSSRHLHLDDNAIMVETSKRGVQILRALALAVRSEQDFDLVPNTAALVGILKSQDAVPSDAEFIKYEGGYKHILNNNDYAPLYLRQALNKIAHANPQSADYYVGPGNDTHELLLFGANQGKNWFAVVSLVDLIKAIRALPDAIID
jgi:hypothetical protein